MIEVNVYEMKTNEIRIDALGHGDGFIDSSGSNGMVIDANLHNFAISPKYNVDHPVYIVTVARNGITFGVRNGGDKVRPCNVKIDFSERAV